MEEGTWVTINGNHVLIEDGKIVKGPKALLNKDYDAYQKSKSKETTDLDRKQEQLEIIQKTNPMQDDYHVGIRKLEDIKTWKEVLKLDDDTEGQFAWGDFTREEAEECMKKGEIKVYSSKPIENGNFVSTSKVQAVEYAGGDENKVYTKVVSLNDVAWINGDEGQYAKIK